MTITLPQNSFFVLKNPFFFQYHRKNTETFSRNLVFDPENRITFEEEVEIENKKKEVLRKGHGHFWKKFQLDRTKLKRGCPRLDLILCLKHWFFRKMKKLEDP